LILRGKLDLLYRRPDGTWHIVDYKTGSTPPEKYKAQLVAYARALRAFLDAPLSASLLYLSPEKEAEAVEVELTEAAFEELEDLARRFTETARDRGPFDRGPEADCPRCPYNGFCEQSGV
ncbi:MAG: RecB family exonuclease, partial [Planctomycetota bacterium]